MTVTLDEMKLFLRVDGNNEDALITSFISTAEEMCEGILRYALTDLETIPETVKQSIYYAVSCFYEQREKADAKAILELMKSLLFSYRKEEW